MGDQSGSQVSGNGGRGEVCAGRNNPEFPPGSVRFAMSLNFLGTVRFVQNWSAEESSGLNYVFNVREKPLK